MEDIGDIKAADCPACGHAMTRHHGRHCEECERNGEECGAMEPGVESPGG